MVSLVSLAQVVVDHGVVVVAEVGAEITD